MGKITELIFFFGPVQISIKNTILYIYILKNVLAGTERENTTNTTEYRLQFIVRLALFSTIAASNTMAASKYKRWFYGNPSFSEKVFEQIVVDKPYLAGHGGIKTAWEINAKHLNIIWKITDEDGATFRTQNGIVSNLCQPKRLNTISTLCLILFRSGTWNKKRT